MNLEYSGGSLKLSMLTYTQLMVSSSYCVQRLTSVNVNVTENPLRGCVTVELNVKHCFLLCFSVVTATKEYFEGSKSLEYFHYQ